jgi:hypothetical protein
MPKPTPPRDQRLAMLQSGRARWAETRAGWMRDPVLLEAMRLGRPGDADAVALPPGPRRLKAGAVPSVPGFFNILSQLAKYDARRLPAIMYQPSIKTKKITLKGNEIRTGGSIIMPALIRIAATIRSIARNGK